MAICGKLLITRSSGLALKITESGTWYEIQERRCVVAVEIMRDILAWSAVINFALLLLWFLFFLLAHDWMYRLHERWFKLSEESFDAIHYAGMAFYKLCILLFNLVPYLSIRIVF